MFLLDTNTVIYYFKGMGQVAVHLLDSAPSEIGISALTLFELQVGLAKCNYPQRKAAQLTALVEAVQMVPFGSEQATHAAAIRAQLEQSGTPIGPYDVLIAGSALSINATLVTHNQREFGRVEGLSLVDWY